MNEQAASTPAPIFDGAPEWLTLPFALIGAGVLFALFILWWGTVLARRRRRAQRELEARGETVHAAEEAAEAQLAPPPAPEPEPAPAPEPAAEVPPPPPEPAAEEVPEPAPLADEPIAAAAPLEASPASLARDVAEPPAPAEPEPEPAPEPEAPAPEPAPDAPAADDLTRMKGVGPRLAERLNSVGIASFAQIAALSPEEADALDAKLGDFQGRIHRDRWIEQAGFLAKGDVAGFEGVFGKL